MQKMLPFSPKKGALHIKTGLFSFDVAGAVGTAGRVLFHHGLAVGALAGGFLHGFFLVQQLVHGLHQQEYAEGDDDEIDDVLQESAVVHRAHPGSVGGFRAGVALEVQREEQAAQVHAASQQADDGHQHIIHQRVDDGGECAADHNAGGQLQNVAAGAEFFEVLKQFFHGKPAFLMKMDEA